MHCRSFVFVVSLFVVSWCRCLLTSLKDARALWVKFVMFHAHVEWLFRHLHSLQLLSLHLSHLLVLLTALHFLSWVTTARTSAEELGPLATKFFHRYYRQSRGNLQRSASSSRANLQAALSSSSTQDQAQWKTSNWVFQDSSSLDKW